MVDDITIVNRVYKPTNITGGHHIVVTIAVVHRCSHQPTAAFNLSASDQRRGLYTTPGWWLYNPKERDATDRTPSEVTWSNRTEQPKHPSQTSKSSKSGKSPNYATNHGFQMLFTSGLDVRVVFVGSQPPTLMDPAGQRKRSLALADSGLGSSEGLNYVELSLQTQHGNMENGWKWTICRSLTGNFP